MIPLSLCLTGFLSYNESTELDFSSFDLACISGSNGAGKSSLLDAITWALFGQARRRDDALINSHAKAAEVVFEFAYEGNIFRIQRTKPRDKTVILEFQVKDADGGWRVLTEKSVRDTEARIQKTLRLDYETFTNASFFLQGKADQFAQQRPGDRKRILSSILGLEIWETYREAAADRRKALEIDLAAVDNRLQEIQAELGEEDQRKRRLKELEAGLAQQSKLRQAAETNLEGLRRLEASLKEQGRLVEMLANQLKAARQRLDQRAAQVASRQKERDAYLAEMALEDEIRSGYAAWQAARVELERWEQVAASFRQVEARRNAPLMAIEKERAGLEQERSQLLDRQQQAQDLDLQKNLLEGELQTARAAEAEVRQQYLAWQAARQELGHWEQVASEFRQFDGQRTAPRLAIEKERAALLQEQSGLVRQQRQAAELEIQKSTFQKDLEAVRATIETLQARLEKRPALDAELAALQDERTRTRTENERLKLEMSELKDRINRLNEAEGAVCPVCGQPLSPAEREQLVASLEREGQEAARRYRSNLEFHKSSELKLSQLATELESLRTLEKTEYQAQNRRAAGLEERLSQAELALQNWQTGGAQVLVELERKLADDDFAPEARAELAKVEARLKELGYDAQAHEAVRQAEQSGRSSEAQLQELSRSLAGQEERLKQVEAALQAWKAGGALRLADLERVLASEDFAAPARLELAKVDQELSQLGYEAAAHDEARRVEQAGRASEEGLRQLENARAALAPLERELAALEAQYNQEVEEARAQEGAFDQASQKYQAEAAALPDIEQAEHTLFDLHEQENRLNMQVGGARQEVEVLKTLKARQKDLHQRRSGLTAQIGRLKQLERAFSKDGVPALLIEQALPEIESEANDILDRLSGGTMSVRFETQREYKDKNRDDKKETLDILISDSAGTREYELFSGGEAFRVNFAIRLALSRVLAQRNGARLQTLVIDEGFGSQDTEGRQRLIEAINLVKPDFAKVLVITHLEELKDAFPARIEVEKTPQGSRLRVV
jgi:exonuclease SbcC